MLATWLDARRRRPPSAPKEHGFWVMLGASLGGALLRVGPKPSALLAALVVAASFVFCAANTYLLVRRSVALQLLAAAGLACAGVPILALARVSTRSIAAGALANGAVFVASVLFARGALAASAKNRARKSLAFELGASGLSLSAAVGLGLAGQLAQAAGCVFSAAALALLAIGRPTAKDMKRLGLSLGVVVGLSTLGPALA